jgi:hypothetical protein
MAGSNRIEIGFEGGQVVPAKVDDGQLKDLRKALDSGKGSHQLESAEETVILDLGKVIFIRIVSGEGKVGF